MVYFPNINDLGRTNDFIRKSPLMNQFNESEEVFENFNHELNEDYTSIVCRHHYHPLSTNLEKIKSIEQIITDGNTYIINFEVPQFNKDELTVKITKNKVLIVEGFKKNYNHDKKYFKNFRKYVMLPTNCDKNSIKSCLTTTGILRITAKKEQELSNILERIDKLNL